jgi:hypothetical protein
MSIRTDSTFTVTATCDACGITRTLDCPDTAAYVELQLRAKGWLVLRVVVDTRPCELCVCPKCAKTVPWIRTFLINRTAGYP